MTAATLSDGATISSLLPQYYKKKWLKRHESMLAYDSWGQQEPIPMGNGRTITFHALLNPAVGYSVGEGAPPTASAVSARKVSATLVQKAWLESISDITLDSSIIPFTGEMANRHAYGGALTKDQYISDAIGFASAPSTSVTGAASAFTPSVFSRGFPVFDQSGEVVLWPNSSTNKVTGLGTYHFSATPTIAHIRGAVTALKNYDAIPFGDGNFRGIIHNTVSSKVRSDSLWPTWNAYSNRVGALVKGQMGVIEGVLFKESTQAFNKALTASAWAVAYTSSGGTLYGTLIFGMGAYGVTKLGGKDLDTTVLLPSKKDKSDPLGQIGVFGYKFSLTAAILNPSAGIIMTWYKAAHE